MSGDDFETKDSERKWKQVAERSSHIRLQETPFLVCFPVQTTDSKNIQQF
jgi:hypothetical protein